MRQKIVKNKMKGFTILEMLVAIFIFIVTVTAATGTFVTAIKGYRNTKAIQNDLESAQYAMNFMAKTIRTSSVMKCNDADDCSTVPLIKKIRTYDYSQGNIRGCVEFEFLPTGALVVSSASGIINEINCQSALPSAFTTPEPLIAEIVNNGVFEVIQSINATVVGKVTTSMEICPTVSCSGEPKDMVRIQTTTSLRDYNISGI